MKRAFLILCAIITLVSCSTIKEDRSECPSYLTFDVDAFIAAGFRTAVVSYQAENGDVFQDEITLAQYRGVGYEVPIERGHRSQVSVVAGLERSTISETSVRALNNSPFDRIWAYASDIEPAGDLEVIRTAPHKQFCDVTFTFPEGTPEDVDFPYVLRVRTTFNGFGLYSLSPLPILSGYETCSYPDKDNGYSVVLPRQGDYDIWLDIILPGDESQAPGQVLYIIDLGKRFIDAGYDWTKQDLDNISVLVDFSAGDPEIIVNPWTDDDTYSEFQV